VRAVIAARYHTTPTAELAADMGMPVGRIHAYARRAGLKKSLELVREMARDRSSHPDHPMRKFHFPKGHVPANKGMVGVCHPAMIPTQFKKGDRPCNWMPLGAVKLDSYGVLVRKVREGNNGGLNWEGVHRLVWKAAHGPIPHNHVIAFKGGKPITKLEDITLDAIECISRKEIVRRNSIWNKSPELARLYQLKGQIKRQVNRITKRNKELRA
jgi:hypothetical protein